MTPKIKIHRFWQDEKQTSGICTVLDSTSFPLFSSLSMERGWMHNLNNISCVPIGVYKVVWEWSEKYQRMLWEIKGVPNRSEAKFHSMNYWYDSEGCIGLGLRYKFLNNDKYRDVTSSVNTMKAFHLALKGYKKATLEITGEEGVF